MRALLAFLLAAQPAVAANFERLPEVRVLPAAKPAPSVPRLDVPELHTLPSQLPVVSQPGVAILPIVGPAAPVPPAARPEPTGPQSAPEFPLEARLEGITQAVAGDVSESAKVSGETSSAQAEGEVRLLQGGSMEMLPAVAGKASEEEPPKLSAPNPQSPEIKRAVSLMMWATPAFKLGTEVVSLSMPLLVMKAMGGATMVAALVIVFQGAQALAGFIAPPLLRRFPASKVLAATVLLPGALIAGLMVLSAAHAVTPWLVLPVYALIGASAGVADTARRLIPTLLLGHDEEALRSYNARLHRRYETAGVIGAALGGGLIALIGPLYAMLIQPPTYLISAYLLWKVRHPASKAAESEHASWREMFRGAKTVLGSARFRWLTAAMILPQIIHRVFENLMLPVYAKTVLGAGALSAVLLTASNFGELGGASFMLKRSAKYPGPSSWVRWAAFGLLAGWMLPLAGAHLGLTLALALLLPAIFVFSATWAGSQLSLDSDVQKSVPEKDQAGVMSFLNVVFLGATALASFGLGRLLDSAGTPAALLWICGGFSAVGVLLFAASRRLRARP